MDRNKFYIETVLIIVLLFLASYFQLKILIRAFKTKEIWDQWSSPIATLKKNPKLYWVFLVMSIILEIMLLGSIVFLFYMLFAHPGITLR